MLSIRWQSQALAADHDKKENSKTGVEPKLRRFST